MDIVQNDSPEMCLLLVQKCFSSDCHRCSDLISVELHVSAWLFSIAQAASVDFKATGFFFYAGGSLSVHWWEQLFKLLLLVLFARMQANHN